MNTKNNRRARDTDEAVIRAFYRILDKKKTVSKVTVREICEEAGVNRSTFYAHYLDVYDLLEQVERHMAEGVTKAFLQQLETAGIDRCFISMFEYIAEHREFYRIYLNETNKAGVIGLARELYSDRIAPNFWKDIGLASPEEMAYHEAFVIAGFTALVRHWLATGCKETPRQLADIFFRHYSLERMKAFQWE